MRLTSDIKVYIRAEIAKKAEAAMKPLKDEKDRLEKQASAAYCKMEGEIKEAAKRWQKEVFAIAKRHGLELDDDHDYASGHVYESYVKDPKRVKELSKKLKELEARIDKEFGRIVFAIEVGKERGAIEDLLAGVKF